MRRKYARGAAQRRQHGSFVWSVGNEDFAGAGRIESIGDVSGQAKMRNLRKAF